MLSVSTIHKCSISTAISYLLKVVKPHPLESRGVSCGGVLNYILLYKFIVGGPAANPDTFHRPLCHFFPFLFFVVRVSLMLLWKVKRLMMGVVMTHPPSP